ncbi:hypothetical protein H310_11515 [Aphanomyces invadans]|uniref:TRAF3-interacting protein 1 n=1 Tax=Aphanomyces invadans TaxID=157072 RepID=A0A024TML3_9STRA|nr:hypothetical protein H310_11515 [Aphanomyces invadans]ETV94851.1 hypothetical protein H310_11515 [Aphanomyces invadans]|eukprot:XP_008876442.1 hypothetical protein H310_11515 [Aphanomyces invadans]
MGDLNELITKTQETLQPLIAKPKLAEKLLQKPPFRFLHDIFSALMASTGFAKGLYTDYELDSANVKEKHQKLQFLDKMVYCTGQCHGKEIDVRSAKIVAGLEPENTNIFLTELALAASNTSLDWNGAVQKALAAFPPLPETLAGSGSGGAEAKPPSEDAPAAKEAAPPARDEVKEAEEKAKAEERAAREKARRAKEEREKEATAAAAQAVSSEPKPSSAESTSRPSSNSKATRNDNNDAGGEFGAQVRECNGDVERTKEMVESIISKPKMSAKLLGKPPFRFLHDVISEVTRVTGFADGLYAGDELDSNAIKEKQPKIDYLQKILHCVGCQLNVEVEAKPAKIVAGLEPEDTNKFLQLLVLAAKAGNSSAAVQRVLAGDTAPRAPSAEAKSKRPSVAAPPQEEPAAPPAQSKSEAKQQAKAESGPMKAMAVTAQDDDGDLASDAKSAGHDEDPSTKPGTANRTARPTTARRRPPKLKENVKEVGRLVRDDKVTPTVGIMKDGDNADSDDEALEAADKGNNHRETMLQNDDTHGKLIRDILKDQNADEEANRKLKEDNDAKGDGGGDSGIRLGKRRKSFKEKIKGGTSTAAEINDLRLSIQKICQATNPVGKCIEYVYEDMEAMARELDVWKKEYEKKCDVLEEEKKKSDEALQPLTAQLVEVEEQIKEQVHKINTLKATIAKNEDKVLKLLRMVVTS